MALFNYATKEITLKIVYYGPGLSGKTTNLQHLHSELNPETKGKLLSLSTEADRTLFFDFLPVELGKIRDFSIRFQLYTVPGQVRYNATRKVVLKGADAVVFVADSQEAMRDQNLESLDNMRENLISNNINPDTIPVIFQYNKRDLKNIFSVAELDGYLNMEKKYEVIESSAISGAGVEETFKRITKMLLKDIARKHKIEIQPAEEKKPSAPELKPAPVPPKEPVPEPPRVELKMPEPAGAPDRPEFEPATFVQDTASFDIFPEDGLEPLEAMEVTEEKTEEPEIIAGSDIREKIELSFSAPEPAAAISMPEKQPTVGIELPAPAQIPAAVPVEPFPIEKIDSLSDKVTLLSDRLGGITKDISSLQKAVSDVKAELSMITSSISSLNEKSEKKEPEIKELKDILRNQKDTSDRIKEILDILATLQEKKSWFKL